MIGRRDSTFFRVFVPDYCANRGICEVWNSGKRQNIRSTVSTAPPVREDESAICRKLLHHNTGPRPEAPAPAAQAPLPQSGLLTGLPARQWPFRRTSCFLFFRRTFSRTVPQNTNLPPAATWAVPEND